MPNTDTTAVTERPTTTVVNVIAARQLLADALAAATYDDQRDPADVALLAAMAKNVRGWTHTTRLREFLEGVSA